MVQQRVIQMPLQLSQVPWGHHIQIITKVSNVKEALYYVQQTSVNNWSRTVLTRQIESDLYCRKGNAITNFELTLPKAQSDLARETLKNSFPYPHVTTTDFEVKLSKENVYNLGLFYK